jgi:hypothetical protein
MAAHEIVENVVGAGPVLAEKGHGGRQHEDPCRGEPDPHLSRVP